MEEINLTALKTIVLEAQSLNESDYTVSSWAVLSGLVDEALSIIEYYIFEELNGLIDLAKEITQDDLLDGWENLQDKITAAELVAGDNSSTEEDINTAYENLQLAINQLIYITDLFSYETSEDGLLVSGFNISHVNTYYSGIAPKVITIPHKHRQSLVYGVKSSSFEGARLTGLTIEDGIKYIGERAFNDNNLPDRQAFVYSRTPAGLENKKTIVSYGGHKRANIVIPSTVIFIGNHSFYNMNITSISLSHNLKEIGDFAFGNNLIEILNIPETVENIGDSAFCSNQIGSISIPSSVIYLGSSSFENNKLKKIKISNSVFLIGENAFDNNIGGNVYANERANDVWPTLRWYTFSDNWTLLPLKLHEYPVGLESYMIVYDGLDTKFERPLTILDNITDVKVQEVLNMDFNVSFSIQGDKNLEYIKVDNYVELLGDVFKIKEIEKSREGETIIIPVQCEHVYFELLDDYIEKEVEKERYSISQIVEYINQYTDFHIKVDENLVDNEDFPPVKFRIERGSPIKTLVKIAETWGVEIERFRRQVKITTNINKDKIQLFKHQKNTSSIKIEDDSKDLIDRLYVVGEGQIGIKGLSLEDVPYPFDYSSQEGKVVIRYGDGYALGVVYVEDGVITENYIDVVDSENLTSVKIGEIVESSLSDKAQLLGAGLRELNSRKAANQTLSLNVKELKHIHGDIERFGLGYEVIVQDEDLLGNYKYNQIKARIIEYEHYPFKPENLSTVKIGQPKRRTIELLELLSKMDNIDQMIEDAVKNLQEKEEEDSGYGAYKEILLSVLRDAENIPQDKYQLGSVLVLQSAIEYGNIVLENENATEEQVDNAVDSLYSAIYNMKVLDTDGPPSLYNFDIYNGISGFNFDYIDTHLGGVTPKDLVIPSEYRGLPVRRISGGYQNPQRDNFISMGITSLILPDSMMFIDDLAFAYNKIKLLELPDSIVSIGERAFQNNELRGYISMPHSIRTLGDYAFYSNNIEYVTIGKQTKEIPASCFSNNLITDVTFYDNKKLNANDEEILLPNKLTKISSDAFANNYIEKLELPRGLVNIENNAFYNNAISELTLPKSIKNIGDYAFRRNIIEELKIPVGLRTIGISAFRENLIGGQLQIPSTVLDVGEYAFDNNLIEELLLSSSLTSIESYAFSNNSISYLSMTATSVSKIKEGAFYNNLIETLFLPVSLVEIEKDAFGDNIINTLSLTANLKSIGEAAFRNNTMTELTMANSLIYISDYAFENNNLTALNMPNYVVEVGLGAFENNKIKNLSLSNSLAKIGSYAFRNNDIIGDIELPDNLNTLGSYAFANNSIETLSINGTLSKTGEGAFENNQIDFLVTHPNVRTISDKCFQNNNLSHVYIPDGIVEIGEYAFSNNNLLTAGIHQCTTLVKIGSYAFSENNINELVLPSSVSEIGDYSFSSNNIGGTLHIPNSVSILGTSAFSGNRIDTLTGCENITSIADRTFYNNELTSISLHNRIVSIGSSAFNNNNLSTLLLPNSVIYIGSSAFERNNITYLYTPDSVTTIREGAFRNNQITALILSNSLTSIESYTFSENNISHVEIPQGVTLIGYGSFRNNKLTQIVIPDSVSNIQSGGTYKPTASAFYGNLGGVIYANLLEGDSAGESGLSPVLRSYHFGSDWTQYPLADYTGTQETQGIQTMSVQPNEYQEATDIINEYKNRDFETLTREEKDRLLYALLVISKIL